MLRATRPTVYGASLRRPSFSEHVVSGFGDNKAHTHGVVRFFNHCRVGGWLSTTIVLGIPRYRRDIDRHEQKKKKKNCDEMAVPLPCKPRNVRSRTREASLIKCRTRLDFTKFTRQKCALTSSLSLPLQLKTST